MSIRRRLTVGVMWMFAGNWTEQVCNLIIFVVLARLLGAELFGLAMMAIIVVIFAEFLVRDSIADALINLKQTENGHLDAVFWSLNVFALGIILAVTLSADLIAAIYDEPRDYWDDYEMCEALMDIANNFQFWRFHHMKTVERIIGHKPGTGGSSGVSFLKKALESEFFPELIQVRTEIGAGPPASAP